MNAYYVLFYNLLSMLCTYLMAPKVHCCFYFNISNTGMSHKRDEKRKHYGFVDLAALSLYSWYLI